MNRQPLDKARIQKFFKYITSDIFNLVEALGISKEDLTEDTIELFNYINSISVGELCKNPDTHRVAIKSGQGTGKTFSTTIVALFRALLHSLDKSDKETKVLVTAPNMKQCKDVWLAQLQKHTHGPKAHPYFKYIVTYCGNGAKILGNKPSIWGIMLLTAKVVNNMRGQHALNMDIFVEEAQGCNEEILTVLRSTQTNERGLYLMIGNPACSSGMFFEAFHTESKLYHTYTWNSEKLERTHWFNPQRNRDLESKYGRDSDYYRVNVLGEFPLQGMDTVISRNKLLAKLNKYNLEEARSYILEEYEVFYQYGVDLARFGGDENVIVKREALAVLSIDAYEMTEPIEMLERVKLDAEYQSNPPISPEDYALVFDATGMGQGVAFMPEREGINYLAFHNHGKAYNSSVFDDLITEAYFFLQKIINDNTVPFYMPKDDITIRQVTSRKYAFKDGKYKLESKKDYKKREGESPDRADGLVMALYPYVASKGVFAVNLKA